MRRTKAAAPGHGLAWGDHPVARDGPTGMLTVVNGEG
jgi:hypothetical protein